jgi:hypothetical protein
MRKVVTTFLLLCSCIFILPGNAKAADGLFSAVTADGLTLKMKRYRPTPDTQFNTGGQPVLLFPGIVCNMNQFLLHTPEGKEKDYGDMTLPEPLADWAEGDAFIEEDPMLYYSIAHYLWTQGYDPWFANYRGTGRGEFRSDKGSNYTTLDVWVALDAPACVAKVRAVTGKAPVVGGHSTGGLVAYLYLQGTKLDIAQLGSDYIPHVQSDPELAKKRNSETRGLLLLDPGCIPPLPKLIDQYSIWYVTGQPVYLDLDGLMEKFVNPLIPHGDIISQTISAVFGMITYKHELYKSLPEWAYFYELDIFGFLNVWIVDNTDPCVEDYFARYCVSGSCMRALTQYGDNSLRNVMRESWKNGIENKDIVIGPTPDRGRDGYYYYDEHMDLITAPAFALFSDAGALVNSQQVETVFFGRKTRHELDEWYQMENTAHLDVVCGYTTPTIAYPMIGDWLSRLCAKTPKEDAVISTSITADGDDVPDGSGIGCGSPANATARNGASAARPGLEVLIIAIGAIMMAAVRRNRRR